MTDADVIVVGGGAGGLTAARYASARGATTLLVTDGPLGGECTYTGCVPSKTLLAAAAAGRGFPEAMADVRAAIAQIASTEDEDAAARAGFGVRHGRAELLGPGELRVDGARLRCRHVILATGSRAALPPVLGLADIGALTNESVFELTERPSRLGVIGGGAIGTELAQAFARLGSRVTVLEAAERLLPAEDPDAADVVAGALGAEGVVLRTACTVERACATPGGGRSLELGDGSSLEVDQVLVAAGRQPVTEGLGLERAGVATEPTGHVAVDAHCATNLPRVWAVGDVTALGGFTHVAGHMGYVAAVNATRRSRVIPASKVERRVVPRVTFTDPELAQVGLTEAEAAQRGGRVAEVPLERVDRAMTSGRTAGFVRLLAGPRPLLRSLGGGQILGATIVGPRAGELISEVALAMRARVFSGRLAQTIHPYPTWSMALQQAAAQLFFPEPDLGARPARG